MKSLFSPLRIGALFAATTLATTASGNELIEDALGGPFTTCTGAIAWTEDDNSATRVEPMRLAVRDADDAANVALFLSEEDFTSEDVWACVDGVCMAHATVRAAVTTNVLRLRYQADLTSGQAVYGMEGVFMVVNAREAPIKVEGARGSGSFICEKALPESFLGSEQ
ncbi:MULTISPECIES: hypothetical protein [unclassified Ruegeria]|uniref:hypothetical protein n=1 Tax=unclassified Ruegeria TaxID=2625375 RepID=UPI00148A0864|nr:MULTISPECIES: hypothetical protein [unclassified Ruegeria]NOD35872.1 hypothetical protein [Ruegeria sp. HKCCD7296]NOE40081.1 hypothetical protein [Ruegeria sp. HKCCD7319]